jgi:hypothetical protein
MMEKRIFGKTGWHVSALGIGTMRLPVLGELKDINEPLAVQLIRRLIDGGVNYLDTAWDYHEGNAEFLVGKALKDGYRQKVKLVTKLPVWLVQKPADFDRLFQAQLRKLDADYVDFYLLHALNKDTWYKTYGFGVLDWLKRQQAEGRVDKVGFSFHDEYAVFKEIVDAWDGWDMCQIQYNYLDQEHQAGTRGLRYASERGMAVSIMEPLRGGSLAAPPAPVRRIMAEVAPERSPAEWALQWLWHQPEVSVVLSGMNSLEQVDENLRSAGRSGVGSLSPAEMELIERVIQATPQPPIPCTRCHYCMPCPNNVNIPVNLHIYNHYVMTGKLGESQADYLKQPADRRASECIHCQSCELVCPQKIAVSEWMEIITRVMEM